MSKDGTAHGKLSPLISINTQDSLPNMPESHFDLSNFLVETFLLNSCRLCHVDNSARTDSESTLSRKRKNTSFIVLSQTIIYYQHNQDTAIVSFSLFQLNRWLGPVNRHQYQKLFHSTWKTAHITVLPKKMCQLCSFSLRFLATQGALVMGSISWSRP